MARLAVAVARLATGEDAAAWFATATIYLAVGIAVRLLVSSVARSAVSIRPSGRLGR